MERKRDVRSLEEYSGMMRAAGMLPLRLYAGEATPPRDARRDKTVFGRVLRKSSDPIIGSER